jgi:hypothetical protein
MDLRALLEPHLNATAGGWLDEALAELRRGRGDLRVLLPALPRRVGRVPCGGGRVRGDGFEVDLGAFRTCDLAAALLFGARGLPDPALVLELYARGDLEERTMLLRSRALFGVDSATLALLGEIQRSNVLAHVEALALDSDVVARAADHGFSREDLNRLLLKLAFLDLPLARAFGVERHANPELSRMLQDLATEREAAGRRVWRDTGRLIGRAPTAGTVARLLGGLEHGDDGTRLAAADGLAALGRGDLAPFLRERLAREPTAEVRAALERALG